MIIKDKNIMFIHIFKTGGSSIASGLFENEGIDYVSYGKLDKKLQNKHLCTSFYKHANASQYKEVTDNYNNFYKFSIVRNPWTRFVSQYHWYTKTNRSKTISEFIKILPKYNHRLRNTQKSFVVDSSSEILLDDIFCFEQLDKVAKKIKINLHHKKNLNTHDFYNDNRNTIDSFVRTFYKEDIEFFGFEPDKMATKNVTIL